MGAKLYYEYGAMNSSKTAQLLMAAHNYDIQNKRVMTFKPALDTRWAGGEKATIQSRSGIEARECMLVGEGDNIYEIVKENIEREGKLNCVFVDEAQFLTEGQVEEIVRVVDELQVPTMCYGLKNTYKKGELFEGSKALLFYADKIEEIKTVCQFCDRKATMNMRVVDGKVLYYGTETVVIGDVDDEGADYYIQTCREHYLKPPQIWRELKNEKTE